MKEFEYSFEGIFEGLEAKESSKKSSPGLLFCHNLEPLREDYVLHQFVVDMNTDSYNWNNAQDFKDYWEDHESDSWEEHEEDYGDYWDNYEGDYGDYWHEEWVDSNEDTFSGEPLLDSDNFISSDGDIFYGEELIDNDGFEDK